MSSCQSSTSSVLLSGAVQLRLSGGNNGGSTEKFEQRVATVVAVRRAGVRSDVDAAGLLLCKECRIGDERNPIVLCPEEIGTAELLPDTGTGKFRLRSGRKEMRVPL